MSTATPLAIAPRLARQARVAVVPLLAATLFLSSFLMFMVEPMVARMLLPILGGVPMVWNGCVVFFQILLLAGYGYAHATTRWLPQGRTALLYAALVLAPLAFLPLTIGTGEAGSVAGAPLTWLFIALITTVGPAFFVLSTSASLLQTWLSSTDHESAGDPYFLYVASNLGSLVALAAYPTVVEPLLGLEDQTRWWALGYAGFAALALGSVAAVRYGAGASRGAGAPGGVVLPEVVEGLGWGRRARWMALAFVPSSLMLGVTNYLSTDLAPMPLLWIVPLWLYLLTFVVAFSARGQAAGRVANRLLPLLLLPLAIMMVSRANGLLSAALLIHVGVFFASAMLCHAELARDRPSPAHLTEFYFWLAFGGMAGGLFNTLVAPVAFSRIVEYPLALGLAALLRPQAEVAHGRRALDVGLPAIAALLALALVASTSRSVPDRLVIFGVAAVLSVAAFTVRHRRVAFAGVVGAMLLASPWVGDPGQAVLHAERTFFGVYQVSADSTGQYRALAHGTTLHGMQAVRGPDRADPLTYYHRTGPLGQALAAIPEARRTSQIAVVGLGVGTLAAYSAPGQRWTFYEIDPAIERLARDARYFTFLDQCGDRCRVVTGDARLSLAASNDRYGVMVLDAFSSDAIPVHLLTREAMALYLSRLDPHGAIALHISNRHLELSAVVGRLAREHGLVALEQRDTPTGGEWPVGKRGSHWVVMARSREDLGGLAGSRRWSPPAVSPSTPLWTDDFSNILSVLRLR